MFIPNKFKITEESTFLSFIEKNAFGQLVSMVDEKIFSTHIPFFLSDDKQSLFAHLAKANPQAQAIDKQQALVTLQGAHGYVSPTWYAEAGVPTWNYQAVHIRGACRVFDDADALHDVVLRLTDIYESGSEQPWQANFKPAMLRGIVGVEIVIDDIQCKFKLSQNRSLKDREQVIAALEQRGEHVLAQAMRDQLPG